MLSGNLPGFLVKKPAFPADAASEVCAQTKEEKKRRNKEEKRWA